MKFDKKDLIRQESLAKVLDYYYYICLLPNCEYSPLFQLENKNKYSKRITQQKSNRFAIRLKTMNNYVKSKLDKWKGAFIGLFVLNSFNFLSLIKNGVINSKVIEKRFKYVFNKELFNNEITAYKNQPLKNILRINFSLKLLSINSLIYSFGYLSLFFFYNSSSKHAQGEVSNGSFSWFSNLSSYLKVITLSLFCAQIPGLLQNKFVNNFFDLKYPLLKETFIFLYRRGYSFNDKFRFLLRDIKKTYKMFLLENFFCILIIMKFYDLFYTNSGKLFNRTREHQLTDYQIESKDILEKTISQNDTLIRVQNLYMDNTININSTPTTSRFSHNIFSAYLAGLTASLIITPFEFWITLKNREKVESWKEVYTQTKMILKDEKMKKLYVNISKNLFKVNLWKYILQFGTCYSIMMFVFNS